MLTRQRKRLSINKKTALGDKPPFYRSGPRCWASDRHNLARHHHSLNIHNRDMNEYACPCVKSASKHLPLQHSSMLFSGTLRARASTACHCRKDAYRSEERTNKERCMEAADKGALQGKQMSRREMLRTGRSEQCPGCGGSQSGEDGASERNAGALANDTSCSKQARGFALRIARGRSHHSTPVGRLEESLTKAGQGQPPDDITGAALRAQLAEEDQAEAGDRQPDW